MNDPAADPRYSRQVRFAPLGPEGQRRIARAHVLLVGVGALGSHSASHLVRAGVGRLTLVDRDVVERSNLQRQILFDDEDAARGAPKALAAAAHLARARPDAGVVPIVDDFRRETFEALDRAPDLVLDGTDNFTTRFLINDLAVAHDLPWIYGGAVAATGSAAVVVPGRTPCLRCLMPDAPPTGEIGTCETLGVIAPAVALVAAFQVAEALKVLAGRADAVTRGLFVVDAWSGSFAVRLGDSEPRPDCRSCGTRELPALRESHDAVATLCGRDAVQVRPPAAGAGVDLPRLARQLTGVVDDLELTPALLRFRADGCRFSVFPGGRAILFGVPDAARARILYDRWIGGTR